MIFEKLYVLSEINECDTVCGGLSLALCFLRFVVSNSCSINVDIVVLAIVLLMHYDN